MDNYTLQEIYLWRSLLFRNYMFKQWCDITLTTRREYWSFTSSYLWTSVRLFAALDVSLPEASFWTFTFPC